MNFTLTINAPELVGAIEKLAESLGGLNLPVETVSPKETPAKPKEVEAVEETFKKNSYFYHSESDSFVSYKKGEAIPTDPDFSLFVNITKADYDKGISQTETPVKEPVKEEPEATKEEPAGQAISIEVVRKKLADFTQGGKAQQTQVREALVALGFAKLSALPPEKYGELLENIGLA